MSGPRTSQSFSGQMPWRLDGYPGGPLGGVMKLRSLPNLEHATICRAFGLDQATYHFDLPSSARGVGSLSSGYGGGQRHGRRLINGFIMMGSHPEPVGKLTLVTESDRFADVDPLNKRDFFDLSHS